LRKPSDLGFADGNFVLPPLITRDHIVEARTIPDGWLFAVPAVGMSEERGELSRTVEERCEMAAELCNAHDKQAVAWCFLNPESKFMAKHIRGAIEVTGSDSDEHKEETFAAFIRGEVRVLVSKPKIAGFGLNLQNCCHQTIFCA